MIEILKQRDASVFSNDIIDDIKAPVIEELQ